MDVTTSHSGNYIHITFQKTSVHMSIWMRSYAGLFLLHPNVWDFSETVTSNVSLSIPFRGKAWPCSEPFCQSQLNMGTE